MNFGKCFLLSLTLFIGTANAAYIGNVESKKMFGSTAILFGVANPPTDTCDYFGRHFYFDATTDSGKNMLSMLLAAEMANRKINVWYVESTAPQTTEKNGCVQSSMAKVESIGFSD